MENKTTISNVKKVLECPKTKDEVTNASIRLGCGHDQYNKDQYVCVLDENLTDPHEFCYNGVIGLQEKGHCPYLSEDKTTVLQKSCRILRGCPKIPFYPNDIYKFPACQAKAKDIMKVILPVSKQTKEYIQHMPSTSLAPFKQSSTVWDEFKPSNDTMQMSKSEWLNSIILSTIKPREDQILNNTSIDHQWIKSLKIQGFLELNSSVTDPNMMSISTILKPFPVEPSQVSKLEELSFSLWQPTEHMTTLSTKAIDFGMQNMQLTDEDENQSIYYFVFYGLLIILVGGILYWVSQKIKSR